MKKAYLALLFLALLIIAGCAPAAALPEGSAGSNPTLITVEELNVMLENKDFTLINVHIPYEGEIPGTDRTSLITRSKSTPTSFLRTRRPRLWSTVAAGA